MLAITRLMQFLFLPLSCLIFVSGNHFLAFVLQVALIVAQSRDRQNRLSGIILTSLSLGLQRIAVAAKKMKGKFVTGEQTMSCMLFRKPFSLVRSKSCLWMALCEVGLYNGMSLKKSLDTSKMHGDLLSEVSGAQTF